jgi:hypothetical protein
LSLQKKKRHSVLPFVSQCNIGDGMEQQKELQNGVVDATSRG